MYVSSCILPVVAQHACGCESSSKKGMAMQAPPLHVVTHLTTEEVQGSRRNGKGTRLDPNGFSRSAAA